ncbi:Protein-L-isoaspartate O-methyltransferase, related [Eimeria tenella]|uniref:protein-L-isoaspartate(D-aspartate) O-methyltransferase n=1 Tax=Eimeria tenella TaxID=5802 RepID=U6L4H4_EIMTE|nr:Protein-L-isoaspartate O-methyltransferase, related [Eimeria tenella]CDJ44108.1 Protein-L-isoaspartate O-methyltransferase, related [Eimeria tenella]|eukprot:XP_013234857.1 Protein-L-isoaspartate O-methyltransferase, related [Eimeria tenella]
MLWGCGRRASRAKIWGVLTAVAAATAATLSSVSFFALTSDPSASFLTHFHSIFRKPTHHFRFLAGQRPPSLLQASPPLSPSLGSPRSATEDPGAPHPFSSSPSSAPRGPPAAAAAAAAEDPPEPPPAVMAWRSHGSNNKELVENLRRSGVFKDQRVFDVMLQVDRGHFVSQDPYLDMPQSIGFGATISAPHMHAIALEQLKEELVWGHRALDVGACSPGVRTPQRPRAAAAAPNALEALPPQGAPEGPPNGPQRAPMAPLGPPEGPLGAP